MLKSIKKLMVVAFAICLLGGVSSVSAANASLTKTANVSTQVATLQLRATATHHTTGGTRWTMGTPGASIVSGSGSSPYCNWSNSYGGSATVHKAYQNVTGVVKASSMNFYASPNKFEWTYYTSTGQLK